MTNWKEIHPDFTEELRKEWEDCRFSSKEVREWIGIGLKLQEAKLAYWLQEEKSKEIKNFADADLEQLREEFANEESTDEFRSPYEEEIENFGDYEEKINAQDWLNQNYPKEKRENAKEIYINEDLEGELDLSDFTKLGKIFISHYINEHEIEIKDKEKYEDKIVKLVNAQEYLEEYLNKNYLEKEKNEITGTLNVVSKNLEGDLEIKNFPSLERLDCGTNKLTSLKVINCPKLKTIYCHSNQLSNLDLDNLPQLELLYCADNYLEDLTFLNNLSQEKLTSLYLHNNDLSEQELTVFSRFTVLKKLYVSNNDKEKIEKGVYNQFVGNLEPLKNLNKLVELNISNTDIDSGLEYLPDSIKTLICEVISDEFDVSKIREQLAPCDYKIDSWRKHLEEWKNESFTNEEIKQWAGVILRLDKLDFAIYLKKEGYTPITFSKIESQAQTWLDWKYCHDKRKNIKKLDINNKGLEGSLKLEGFDNLEELNCSNNKLTNLDLSGLECLSKIQCSFNELNDTNFLTNLPNPQQLTYLNISDNNFHSQNLSFLERLTNLEELSLGTTKEKSIREDKYNRFTGSLEFLKDLSKLKILNISNTEIETGLEYLLESAKDINEIHCSSKENPESRVSKIDSLLKEKKTDFAFINNKYKRLVIAQEWLDKEYPLNRRNKVTELRIDGKLLTGSLQLEGFDNLEKLYCHNNYLTDINSLLSELSQEKLKVLYLYDNNFSESDLTPFERFVNLELLIISSNLSRKDYEQGVTNRFTGSLQPLQGLTKLKSLYINGTDIDRGLEYLPEDLNSFYCADDYWGATSPKAKVKKISTQLRDYGSYGNYNLLDWKRNKQWQEKFDNQEFKHEFKEWKKVGLKTNEVDFAAWLEETKNYKPSDIKEDSKKKERLKEYHQAETWLNFNYPINERDKIERINISKKHLEGDLNLNNFKSLIELNCSENQLTSLEITGCSNLRILNCSNNQITELNLTEKLDKLETFSCNDNFIKELNFNSLNPEKLTILNITNNNLTNNPTEQNISNFSKFAELKELLIGNDNKEKIDKKIYNRFSGSLNSLKDLTKLESLHISNTDINEINTEKLPENLSISKTRCSAKERPKSKVESIQEKLYSHLTKKYLNEMYPDKSAKILDNLYSKNLKGHLDLSEYENLEELNCSNNQLTSIDVSKNTKLKKLVCYSNQLKKLIGIEICDELSFLNDSSEEKKLKEFLSMFPDVKNKEDELVEKIIKNREIQEKGKERAKLEGGWKKKSANDWLGKEYPKDGNCLGEFDWENKGKKRSEIKELDISGEELTDELNLEEFTSLKHLICHDNQLKSINLGKCGKIEIINCRNNKLEKIEFAGNDLNLREFHGSNNEFNNLEKLISNINSESLNYLNVNNNKISNGKLDKLAEFRKLKGLFIGSDDKNKKNNFTGFLEDLKGLNELLEIDIRNNNIKIDDVSKEEKSWPNCLEKIYYAFKKDEELPQSNEKEVNSEQQTAEKELKKTREKIYYNEEGKFYDIKTLRMANKVSDYSEVKVILKAPLLATDKKHKVNITKDNYEIKKIDYYNEGKAIYPSEKETGFGWEIGKPLSSSDLPIRLCQISNSAFVFFSIKKYFEKNNIKRISSENNSSLTIKYEDEEEREIKNISSSKEPKLQEIKSYLEKNNKNSLGREELTNAKIEIKKRVECADDAKHYAILSYSWGGKHKEEIPWSSEKAEERLSLGGIKSLDKAIKTLRVLNEFHLLKGDNIKYLWMDQLCVNQDNPKEKGHEVSKMRDYYGNATVSLIAIHADVGEENIRKLLKSFEKGESGLIYPNEIIESSLPILEKIMGSEWFSRSWTFQEGFLSKRTIFMFDDFLIDGRFVALIWKLKQFSSIHYEECKWMKDLCGEKAATPVGWIYYEDKGKKGYSLSDKASLRLTEALWAVKDRGRALPIDGIYSIIGLLPYSDKVKVNYEKDPESVLREVMLIAVNHGHGEPLSWSGWGSRKLGLCWVPAIDENGSSSVTGGIKVDYDFGKKKLSFESNEGIRIQASEYVISKKSSGFYEVEMREAMEGSLWMREIWVKAGNGEEKLILSGTKEGIEAVSKGRMLIVPNREIWKSDKSFAILALKVRNYDKEQEIDKLMEEIYDLKKSNKLDSRYKEDLQKKKKELDNTRHRIDLLRIEEGYKNLVTSDKKGTERSKTEERTFIIGLDNQEIVEEQYQIQIPPK